MHDDCYYYHALCAWMDVYIDSFFFTLKITILSLSTLQSATMQEVWMRRALANINDSHNIYLSDLTRIAHVNYIPTEYDILISRLRTTQVTVERYTIDGIQFEVYDVGGQRSERRKWIGCFENVDAVIFVAALSEYDQTLAESRRQNRMMEALNLFESVVKNENFADTSIMLFLNKKDIFAEKIMYSNIADSPFFSDYAGPPQDFDHGVLYFIQKFEEHLGGDEFNDSFIHVTCATDTNNMEFVLDSSRTIIMTDVSDCCCTGGHVIICVVYFVCIVLFLFVRDSHIVTCIIFLHSHIVESETSRISWDGLM
jgi:GTPase SAR1 family protein